MKISQTYVFVAGAWNDVFINTEDVSAWESVSPTPAGEISDGRHLGIRFVLVASGSVSSIKPNL